MVISNSQPKFLTKLANVAPINFIFSAISVEQTHLLARIDILLIVLLEPVAMSPVAFLHDLLLHIGGQSPVLRGQKSNQWVTKFHPIGEHLLPWLVGLAGQVVQLPWQGIQLQKWLLF